MHEVIIEKMTEKSWKEVAKIYQAGIATKNATFETEVPDWETWDKSHRKDCRLVALMNHQIVGWVALSSVSSRCIYAGVAEVSIYVNPDFQRKGIGDKLMEAVITESEAKGIWTLQAGIFPENKGSLALHYKHGFRTVGIKKRIGKMDNIWRDVTFLERRSKVAGIN
ncbi:GNAT family N-acetyltransferase [Microbacter margulisiae]|uniref:Phosphinothricin acetyltransferase n=1 Tax=Microbacter margulisiae TaxID=1350067 RepID=A0A7W5DQU7_9PORP|nr:GNAT family N-acetyltransferase [Microbacter margulisiae]MBB3186598.1 phosphinothricin acetyltransferase [Microbacter margulisiae]